MPDGSPLIIGRTNTGTATTVLDRSGEPFIDALDVKNGNGSAVFGKASSTGFGVIGQSLDGVSDRRDMVAGVFGTSRGEPGTGTELMPASGGIHSGIPELWEPLIR